MRGLLQRLLGRAGSSRRRASAPPAPAPPRRRSGRQTQGAQTRRAPARGSQDGEAARTSPYPGDFTGTPSLEYAPNPDGRPDPGEIVWTWVPFEEDYSQGKDRPVLLIGHDDPWLLALMLTSKDHDRDLEDEARHGRHWVDIGAGAWDARGRPSEVRVDRVVRVHPRKVRREGAALDAARFAQVADAVRRHGSGRGAR